MILHPPTPEVTGNRSGGISTRQLELNNQMRLLWEQHVYWTRFVISGIVLKTPDLQASNARLMQNPADFAAALQPFYGRAAALRFARLFSAHLTIAGELVTAAAAGQPTADAERRWYENADQIAAFLASVNPYWTEQEWREMMYRHLSMTKQEAVDFINGNFTQSVTVFDQIEQEALMMADTMSSGIVKQFPAVQ